MQALTMEVYVDDIEGEEEGIADSLLDTHTIASVPKPGISLKHPGTAVAGQSFRPRTQTGSEQFFFTNKINILFQIFYFKTLYLFFVIN